MNAKDVKWGMRVEVSGKGIGTVGDKSAHYAYVNLDGKRFPIMAEFRYLKPVVASK